jgi:tetratricopeptide (TPR) repeat protein
MLLDRKKVKFWQRIIFGGMAFLMAAFLVVGYSGALSSCQSGGGILSSAGDLDEEIEALEQRVAADPTDVVALGELGDAYMSRSSMQTDEQSRSDDLSAAVRAYERKVALLEEVEGPESRQARRDTLESLATIYLSLNDYDMAMNVYGQLTSLAPKNAQYFFDMGSIAITAGDTDRALLAFNRYLQLEPDSPDAEFVEEWITANSPDTQGSPQ